MERLKYGKKKKIILAEMIKYFMILTAKVYYQ